MSEQEREAREFGAGEGNTAGTGGADEVGGIDGQSGGDLGPVGDEDEQLPEDADLT